MPTSRLLTVFLLILPLGWGCSQLTKPSIAARKTVIQTKWARTTTFEHKFRARFLEPMRPLLSDEMVFHGNSVDSFTAYSRKNGQIIWKKPVENGASGGAEFYKDSILFGGNDGHFYRLNQKTGELIWSYPTRSESLSAPLVEGNRVFFVSGNGTLYCLDVETGEKLWLHSRRATNSFSIRGGSKPAARADKLFVGFADGSLVAFSIADGKVLWEQRLNRNKKFRDIDSSPIISGFELFVSGYDSALYNLDWSTGQVNWRFDEGGFGEILLSGDTIFLASSEGELIAIERKNGKKKWAVEVQGIATQPAIVKGYLIYGESDGNLQIRDANSGISVTSFQPGRGVFSPPAVTEEGDVFFASNQSNLYALKIDFRSKAHRWPWQKAEKKQ